MRSGIDILKRNKLKLRIAAVLNAVFYALGIALFVLPFINSLIFILVFIFSLMALLILIKPWLIDTKKISSMMDYSFDELEFSTSLLLKNKSTLNLLEQLQYKRVHERLTNNPKFKLPFSITNSIVFMIAMLVLGNMLNLAFTEIDDRNALKLSISENDKEVAIDTNNIDSIALKHIEVTVIPPTYTNERSSLYGLENINLIEGSTVKWQLQTSDQVDRVELEIPGKGTYEMRLSANNTYTRNLQISTNSFYSINLYQADTLALTTNLYTINTVLDNPPKVEINGISSFQEIEYNDPKEFTFEVLVSDDFGISDAYIVATVTKGSGESVKFRESRLEVGNEKAWGKRIETPKTLDLEALNMEIGDELYFYLKAIDNKPKSQSSRTDTYFISIRDTTEITFSVAGSLGVDVMPEYFRSQRQIIIDSEKLLKNRAKLTKKEFDSKSNNLAHDQKTLRLKYGQFMGVEDESGIAIEAEVPDEAGQDGDLLDEYSHDHDGDNEHNLVEEDHDHAEDDGEESPLENYLHDHDDPEEATLYTQSTRSMLKEALSYMWDSELYLRLNEPEKSLPFQYKSLELIKKIKNQARIYVHRIGFDPPPIKEDKRLSGDLDEVESVYSVKSYDKDEETVLLLNTIQTLSDLKYSGRNKLDERARNVINKTRDIIALRAIDQPIKYLKTLELLKEIANTGQLPTKNSSNYILGKLNEALPDQVLRSSKLEATQDSLSSLFLNQLYD